MIRSVRATLVFLLASGLSVPPGVAAAQGKSPASLYGTVRSRTGAALAGAEVLIRGTELLDVTDSAGQFEINGIPPGLFVVLVRRIGFNPQYLSAVLTEGEAKGVRILLDPGATTLPDIEVTAPAEKPIEYAYTHKYDDYFHRKKIGLGHFIDRAFIERRQPYETVNLLDHLPGVRVRFNLPFPPGSSVQVIGCDRVSVWIDGWKQQNLAADAPRIPRVAGRPVVDPDAVALAQGLSRVLPIQIEMMEVYTGPASMPAEFLDDSCAAVVIWTRQ